MIKQCADLAPPPTQPDATFIYNTIVKCCTDQIPFPQPPETFSLTNFVEIVKIDSLCNTNQNHFEMVGVSERRIREEVAKFNINQLKYTTYIVNNNKLEIISFDDQIEKFRTYFFINNKLICRKDLLDKIIDLYNLRYGTKITGSVYFPKPLIRFPPQMPSRGHIFR